MSRRILCPGCGLDSDGREALCGVCWATVPQRERATVRAAQKAVGYNPASWKACAILQQAIADAVGAIR